MKKITCAFLAIVMCMALAVPALAVSSGTSYAGRLQGYTIAVTAISNSAIVLNPYQVSFTKASVVSGASASDKINPAIFAPSLILKSDSDVPLKMTLTATGSIPNGSNAAFSATQLAATEKNRKVFIYLVVDNQGSKSTSDAPTAAAALDGITAYSASSVWSASNTTGTQAVFKVGDVKLTDICTIPVPETNESSYVKIDIGGECTKSPTDGWTSTDVVNVSLAYTFQASNNPLTSGS